jgi:hypothetical protein
LDSPYFFEGTTYWSDGDERAHFEWMERIPCIRDVRGEGRRVYLDIADDEVTSDDLRELQALYRRYSGDSSQLNRLNGAAA